MTLFVPAPSEATMLRQILASDTVLKLFVNNVVPADFDTAATYTEMSTHGYAAITLATNTWTYNSSSRPSKASYPESGWTFTIDTNPTPVYGYYIVQATTGLLLWVERFDDGPYTMQAQGDQIRVTPVVTLK